MCITWTSRDHFASREIDPVLSLVGSDLGTRLVERRSVRGHFWLTVLCPAAAASTQEITISVSTHLSD